MGLLKLDGIYVVYLGTGGGHSMLSLAWGNLDDGAHVIIDNVVDRYPSWWAFHPLDNDLHSIVNAYTGTALTMVSVLSSMETRRKGSSWLMWISVL